MTGLLATTEPSRESPSSAEASGQEVDQRKCHDMKQLPWYALMLCRLGIHRGKWEYVAEGNCSQLKVCRYCGITRLRTKHRREWRYVSDYTCEQDRVCQRCGEVTRHRTKHMWGETYSVGYKDAHKCQRCGEIETWVPKC